MADIKNTTGELTAEQAEQLLKTLKSRFEKHPERHEGIEWAAVQSRLVKNAAGLWSLNEMEGSGGEPDVVGYNQKTGGYIFADCSAESPAGRRNLAYDRAGRESRKANQPEGSAEESAAAMGIAILSEEQYRDLQKLGNFDTKTSSWLKTPEDVRKLGGALFGDRRFGRVFIYHNGAASYYGVRGFRGTIEV